MHNTAYLTLALAVLCLAGLTARAEDAGVTPAHLIALPRVSSMANGILPVDPVQALIVAGKWEPPKAGDVVTAGGAARTWEVISPTKEGVFEHPALSGGYAYWPVSSNTERVAILEASGHASVWVNGEPRAGDVYGYGYVRLPVRLKKGRNDLLFRGGRGRLQARLIEPDAPVTLDVRDATLPDLHQGKRAELWGAAVVVINATDAPVTGMALEATIGNGKPASTPLPPIGPLSARKVQFRLDVPSLPAGEAPLAMRLTRNGETRSEAKATLRVRKPGETYKHTFISRMDDSVQYFGVNPSSRPDLGPQALVLSLHGASVEAIGQADAYSSKTWATLVAPTNRRPYGYDWEDWGRQDAMEVLEIAQSIFGTDPARTYLTGHSMGGHGAWHVGALYPGRFAAIGPSAGWISVHTYGRANAPRETGDGAADILRRAASVGDTEVFLHNYADAGVYILHGDADETVPVEQARAMRDLLSPFHKDLRYHEEPKQGHWWDLSDEPGADCVDWAPMFDMFARRALPPTESVRRVDFTTVNPAVSATSYWVTVGAQEHIMRPSRVQISCDPHLQRFHGTTENVRRLELDLWPLTGDGPVTVELDGQKLEAIQPEKTSLFLRRDGGRWAVAGMADPSLKGPRRYGPFRHAFDHRMQFVYGTRGTADERAWAYARARYDAETWWYRGNGSVDVIPDTAFDARRERDRSVILYGNADTNRAWGALLAGSPVVTRRGETRVGNRVLKGDDLACLFVRPRPGSERASVGVVAGTGLPGMRLTESLPYLQPMVGFPDVLVVGADVLRQGLKGVRTAGFFGEDWRVDSGDFAWGAPDGGTP